MSFATILLPLFVLVALTFVLLFWMGFSRIGALKAGQVKMGDVALGQTNRRASSKSPTAMPASFNCRCCSMC